MSYSIIYKKNDYCLHRLEVLSDIRARLQMSTLNEEHWVAQYTGVVDSRGLSWQEVLKRLLDDSRHFLILAEAE